MLRQHTTRQASFDHGDLHLMQGYTVFIYSTVES